MNGGRILVIDDEEDMLEVCSNVLRARGATVETETDPRRALQRLCNESFDVVLLDIRMPKLDGIELIRTARSFSADTSFVLMTGFPTAQTAEESARLGAYGYVTKPFSNDQLLAAVTRALIARRLRAQPPPSVEAGKAQVFDGMIGGSPAMQQVFALIQQVGPVDIDVLVMGESGTGKELVARSIHQRSSRSAQRFVPLDCGAIPEHLLEGQLFGHEKGAFTGAVSSAIGLMEFAHQGALFLDEICELAPALQVKLLRALQERKVRRIGGTDLVETDVRVIAATNRDIDCEVREGRFRQDLFYRLNAIRVGVPPLRERREDIAPMFAHFLERAARQANRPPLRVEGAVYHALAAHAWPGNVRELENVARRAAVVCEGDAVGLKDLPPQITEDQGAPPLDFMCRRALKVRDFERDYLADLMRRHGSNVQGALQESGISRATFYRLLKKYGLKLPPEEGAPAP